MNIFLNCIKVLVSIVTSVATVVMAVAAWQAKDEYKEKLAYDEYLKLSELLFNCTNKLSHLSSEEFDDENRKTLTENIGTTINQANKYFYRLSKINKNNQFEYETKILFAIIRFHACLLQQACSFEDVRREYIAYLEDIINIKKEKNEPIIFEEKILTIQKELLDSQIKKEEA